MRKYYATALLGMALAALVGCNTVAGNWQFHHIDPESAAPNFTIKTIHLAADGTYTADIRHGGRTEHAKGTYDYNPLTKVLELTTDEGNVRKYKAEKCSPCGTLKVWNAGDDMHWQAVFSKE